MINLFKTPRKKGNSIIYPKRVGYCLVLGPLFQEFPYSGASPYTKWVKVCL